MSTKVCTRCGTKKPVTAFRLKKVNGKKPRPLTWCRECCNEYNKQYRNSRTGEDLIRYNEQKAKYARSRKGCEKHYAYHIRHKFGIELADYNKMLASQNGVCAICHQPETSVKRGRVVRLSIDHDHTTNAIRGLLCDRCNALLGRVRDDVTILQSAIKYLKHHATGKTP